MLLGECLGLFVLLVLLAAGDTPVGRRLHRAVVAGLAARLLALRRGTVMTLSATALLVGALLYLGGGDAARMIAMGAPDAIAWFTTFEMSAYADALVAVVAASSALRLRAVVGIGRARALGRPGRRRDRRSRTCRAAKAANDDEPDPVRARAA